MMTVKDLIKKLQRMNPDEIVMVESQGYCNEISGREPEVLRVRDGRIQYNPESDAETAVVLRTIE